MQQTEEFPLGQQSSATIDSTTVVYSNVAQNQDSDLGSHQLYENVPSTTTPDSIETSQPDIVYAQIAPSQEPGVLSNRPTDRAEDESVLYSELQSKNNDSQTAAPSSDLSTQVQQRSTLYPS